MATEVDIQSPIPVPISGHVVVDTGSIAIGNSINIANFPITYPVTGTVDIANLPAIQSVLLTNPLPILVATVGEDRKSTRLNSSHSQISYAVFCLKKKKN